MQIPEKALPLQRQNRRGGKAKPTKPSDYEQIWRFRLAARTHASHAWNTGSIPVGATILKQYPVRIKNKRRFRLAARTHASHAWNTGSIPVGATQIRLII